MKTFRGLESPEIQHPTVLTLGVFDGLHLGHQKIMQTVVERARATSSSATVITFDPHPRAVLHPETAPPLLQTLDQKLEGMEQLGIDQVIILEFNRQLASYSAEDFLTEVVYKNLQPREVYIGKGFAFGRSREGNIDTLIKLGQRLGFRAEEVPEVKLRKHRVSSTMIRRLLRAGRVNLARRMLGRPYGVEGTVLEGRKIGKRLSYPTANLLIKNSVIPANGVYVTLTMIDNIWHRSVTNIGTRPTFGDEQQTWIETHVIDFDREIYGQQIRVQFLHRLRGEKRFPDSAALQEQIGRDYRRAVIYFQRLKVQANLVYGT